MGKLLPKLIGVVALKALVSLALVGFGVVRVRRTLEPGDETPRDLVVTDQDGKPLNFGEILHEPGWIALFFFPRAGTAGCTRQACNIRDGFTELRDRGVRIFGASGDSPAAQAEFRKNLGLPFTLIADGKGELARAFGVTRVGPISPRHTFLIKDGKVVHRQLWADPATQTEELLKHVP
jgi:peroxiredoxin Q/BCP